MSEKHHEATAKLVIELLEKLSEDGRRVVISRVFEAFKMCSHCHEEGCSGDYCNWPGTPLE